MAKLATNAMIDGGLDKVDYCVSLTVCAGQPTSFADIAVKKLATVTIDGTDFTNADGDTSGRKLIIGTQIDMSITATGTADHVAIDDGTDYVITTATSQGLTSGGTVTTPAFDYEIGDPT